MLSSHPWTPSNRRRTSSDLMDQCSTGTTSHQRSRLLTNHRGHDLGLGLGRPGCRSAHPMAARTPILDPKADGAAPLGVVHRSPVPQRSHKQRAHAERGRRVSATRRVWHDELMPEPAGPPPVCRMRMHVDLRKRGSRLWESNPRPTHYEGAASGLPPLHQHPQHGPQLSGH